MNVLSAFKIVKQMGLPWTVFRLNYEVRKKTGLLKRQFPPSVCSDEDFLAKIIGKGVNSQESLARYIRENRRTFFFKTGDFQYFKNYLDVSLSEKDKKKIIDVADNAINGRILCFSRWIANYGNPINWHMNPVNRHEWSRDIHWVDLEELSREAGDVKYVWEASRFTQVFYFVRAYVLTGDEKYAKAYWNQVEHWLQENPYQLGINWKCGQEVSFRTFAWIFGLYAFLDSHHTTDERIYELVKAIYYNAIRVESNIDFAVKAVQNNHAISEAACLFSVGTLFPFFKDSSRFFDKGRMYLEQEGIKQIYEDGSYIQHSMNYHRLVLQVYTWCFQLANLNNITFIPELKARLKKAIDFLYQMQDGVTGQVPNYGANDGALVFPLSACDYTDYKPQLNTINYIINGEKLYESGIHEEDLLWFCGTDAVQKGDVKLDKKESRNFDIGGYYTIRGKDSFGLIRCTKFTSRPGHADMLHFDLWYKGVNILTDIGSYSYNPEEKYRNYFNATRNHNTLTINNMNQSRKGPRFLTLDWPEGILREFRVNHDNVLFSGYHTAYENCIHTRTIEFDGDCYIINDEVENRTGRKVEIKLNWNLGADYEKINENRYSLAIYDDETVEFEITSLTPGNTVVYCGNREIPAGWSSLYYGEKSSLRQLVYEVTSDKDREVLRTVVRV